MRRIAALVTALVLTLALAAPATAGSHQKVPVEGSFVANWHVWTLSLTEQGPHKCLLQLDADLAFDGDLVGTALGSYDVLVFASCEEAAASPPGVLKELFWYWGSADLSIGDSAGQARIKYRGAQGEPNDPGELVAQIDLTGEITGMLKVTALGGGPATYSGFVHVRD
ncbi:MAG TPA: hypothetical protein VLA23_05960 [Candidatus Limnocylindrales bacterium]|nr:hypothetical protein [Candidatus Limnocylindrales bacterium]